MRFLPALRSKTATPTTQTRFRGAVDNVAHPGWGPEAKTLFASYAGAVYDTGRDRGLGGSWTVDRAVSQAYGRLVWVWKCVNTISGDSSALDVIATDGENTVDDHPGAALLNDGAANPLETGRQMRKRLSGQALLSPRGAFVEVVRNNRGDVVRYDLLPPGRTRIVPATDGDGLVSHVVVARTTGGYYRVPWENVLWFRDPHPTDPFAGTTPLEAAGMSIELDYFARLFNASFMRNDGRPGGILAVRGTGDKAGDVDRRTLEVLERDFSGGPREAGKVTAITGDLTYQDLGSTPRDMQYAEASGNAKTEILSAFGVPETVMGHAAGRTYDNAAQEEKSYWAFTMRQHNSLITTGLAPVAGDGHALRLDTSRVEVLQAAEQARRKEARDEVAAGLRSPWSYAQLAGIEDVEDTPVTRALYVGAQPLGGTQQTRPAPSVDAAPRPLRVVKAARAPRPPRLMIEPAEADEPARVSDQDTDHGLTKALEDTLAGIMGDALARAVPRLESPKTRKGTRHWVPEYPVDTRVGTKALDVAYAVDDTTVEARTRDEAGPLVEAAMTAAAAAVAADLAATTTPVVTAVVTAAAVEVTGWLASTMGDIARGLAGELNGLDQSGLPLADVVAHVRDRRDVILRRVARLAGDAAHTAVVTARDAAATTLIAHVTREWVSRRDTSVRHTHAVADGQTRAVGEPFDVGQTTLRYPRDPAGPLDETAGCRCRVRYTGH